MSCSLESLSLFNRRAIDGTVESLSRLIWSEEQSQERLLDAHEDLAILYEYVADFPAMLSPAEKELCWFCQVVATWLRKRLDEIEAEINEEYDKLTDQMWGQYESELAMLRLEAAEDFAYR